MKRATFVSRRRNDCFARARGVERSSYRLLSFCTAPDRAGDVRGGARIRIYPESSDSRPRFLEGVPAGPQKFFAEF